MFAVTYSTMEAPMPKVLPRKIKLSRWGNDLFCIPLVHKSDSMDELIQLSIRNVSIYS